MDRIDFKQIEIRCCVFGKWSMLYLLLGVVVAAKLPILNPNEFDLWNMRIEQYFLMTDYSLWEVILNGDSSSPTRIVDGAVQIIAPTTAKQSIPKSPKNDRYKTGEGYHVVPPPYTRTFMRPKPDLVFNDAPNASESVANVVYFKSSSNKPSKDMSKTLRLDAPIIEDWIFDSKYETKIESVPKQKELSFVPTSEHVKTPRDSVKKVKHPKQAKNLRTNIPKSRGHKKNWNKKACFVCRSLNHLIKDCDYYEKQMVQKPVWNSAMRVNRQNLVRMTHLHSNRNVVPTAVLTRS
nr:ribonuclease H-like domain-containing protein [Tanacetum cinerariifolium]